MDRCSSSSSLSNTACNVQDDKDLLLESPTTDNDLPIADQIQSPEQQQQQRQERMQQHVDEFRKSWRQAMQGPMFNPSTNEPFAYDKLFEAIVRLELRMDDLQKSVDDATTLVRRFATAKEQRSVQVDGPGHRRGANSAILYGRPPARDENDEVRRKMSTATSFRVVTRIVATGRKSFKNAASAAGAAESQTTPTIEEHEAAAPTEPTPQDPNKSNPNNGDKDANMEPLAAENHPPDALNTDAVRIAESTQAMEKTPNDTASHTGTRTRSREYQRRPSTDTFFMRRLSVGSFVVPEFEKLQQQLVQGMAAPNSNVSLWHQLRHLFRRMGKKSAVLPGVTDLPPLLAVRYRRNHVMTFSPDSSKRVWWDYLMLTMVLVQLVVTPLSLSFEQDFPEKASERIDFAGIVIFAMDFVLNCLTSYRTAGGEMIVAPKDTIRHYLVSGWALPDFLSFFPFEYVFTSGGKSRLFVVLKVIRLVKVSQLAKRFNSAKKAGALRFIRLISVVFLISHCGACFWNFFAKDWKANSDDYHTLSIGAKYSRCWSLVIGSLNASPPAMYNPLEEITVACLMLIGNYVQAVVFGSVAVLISSLDEEDAAYSKKMMDIYERCRLLGMPEALTQRIHDYYESLYRETKSTSSDADSFIDELSPALICEVKYQLYRDMLKQIPFFSTNHLDSSVVEFLVLHLRTVSYMQEDVVIRKGEYGDWMGFIGSKGCVGVLDPSTSTRRVIRILRKGDYFGEMSLLQRSKRSTTAVALTWVQIHVLCRDDLDDVRAHYPEEALVLEDEIIQYMKSKVVYKIE